MKRIFLVIAAFIVAVVGVLTIGTVIDHFRPTSVFNRTLGRAAGAGDDERVLEITRSHRWSLDKRYAAARTYARLGAKSSEHRDTFEARLVQLRDDATSDDEKSVYQVGLTELNQDRIREIGAKLYAHSNEFDMQQRRDGLAFDSPETVDILLDLNWEDSHHTGPDDPSLLYFTHWSPEVAKHHGIFGLNGLSRAEIDARFEAASRLGLTYRFARIIGHYNCRRQAYSSSVRDEAFQSFAELLVFDLDTGALLASKVVTGDEPPKYSTLMVETSNCSRTGPAVPNVAGSFSFSTVPGMAAPLVP